MVSTVNRSNFVYCRNVVILCLTILLPISSYSLFIVKPCCTTVEHFPITFGPTLSKTDSIEGQLQFAGLQCSTDHLNSKKLLNKIGYVALGSCSFIKKIINAQKQGALAIIIYGNITIPHTIRVNTSLNLLAIAITIPTVFLDFEGQRIMNEIIFSESMDKIPNGMPWVRIDGGGERKRLTVNFVSALLETVSVFIRIIIITWVFVIVLILSSYLKARIIQNRRLSILKKLPVRTYYASYSELSRQSSDPWSTDCTINEDKPLDNKLEDSHDSGADISISCNQDLVQVEDKKDINNKCSDVAPRENSSDSVYIPSDSTYGKQEPFTDYFENENCVVCLFNFESEEKILVLPCGHGYHKECIEPWIITKSSRCPICKKSILPTGDTRPLEQIDPENTSQMGTCNQAYKMMLFFSLVGFFYLAMSSD